MSQKTYDLSKVKAAVRKAIRVALVPDGFQTLSAEEDWDAYRDSDALVTYADAKEDLQRRVQSMGEDLGNASMKNEVNAIEEVVSSVAARIQTDMKRNEKGLEDIPPVYWEMIRKNTERKFKAKLRIVTVDTGLSAMFLKV